MKFWSRRRVLQLLSFTSYGFSTALFTRTIFPLRGLAKTNSIVTLPFQFESVAVNSQGQEIHSIGHAKRFIEILGSDEILEMVAIPSGTFEMGSSETEIGRDENEGPTHAVTVDAFSIGRYPITQSQWQSVAALPKIKRFLDPNPSAFKGDNNPVERICWYDAVEFCARLSKQTGRTYRLPTEAEWEYACRAGTTTSFHFGENLTTVLANYNGHAIRNFKKTHSTEIDEMLSQGSSSSPSGGSPSGGNPSGCPSGCPSGRNPSGQSGFNSSGNMGDVSSLKQNKQVIYRQQTTSVGSFQVANAFGLSDMHGLVWEWCADHWHDNYEGSDAKGRAWLSDNEYQFRVMRGGAWSTFFDRCRAASRSKGGLYDQSYNIGFRVVCELT
ncbi:hypothetical protein WA1_48620 [Scytonema hofmannii PCC 7110]|uniref:Sulfatase-modifying factor enzyme-like domain-containing protein n=1 Tax=Scytonema hofmannii PCC 7110 TaxID=128403 RepID=A0A139WTX3_9CYAN|nr:formylglycine-generating enzyme family protein [Scytonema hofmannii]KYC35888.1 hypothetical protein WA1_48620 [Scytonema hofmannii PCC 7110]